jgi:hypothetical protein
LLSVYPCRRNEIRLAGSNLHGPFIVVQQSVVETAEHDKIFDVGRPATFPFQNVVHIAPRRRSFAAGKRASAIPDDHGAA